MESSSAMATVVGKMRHGLSEVRNRAIGSLNSKLRNGITSVEKLARETDVCQEVLRLCEEPVLLTEGALELLDCLVECRESFLCLHVLGLEEKVRNAAEHSGTKDELRKPLHEILAKVLSTSRNIDVSSSSGQGPQRFQGSASEYVPRLPSFIENRGVTLRLDSERFRHLPKFRSMKVDKKMEQTLFEINFRLEHGDDEFTLLASLQELSQQVCRDYPPQVILQQNNVFDNLLRLLHLKVSKSVYSSAVHCLDRILGGCREGLELSHNKDILPREGLGESEEHGDHLGVSYPQTMYVPGDERDSVPPEDLVDLPSYTHMAILHLLTLLCDNNMHYETAKPIFSALDLLRSLGQSSNDDSRYDGCVAEYLGELQEVFEKFSLSWSQLHEEREKGKRRVTFQLSVFDQNLVYVAAEILTLGPSRDAAKLVSRKMQAYLCEVFNSESVGMCVPQLQASLLPLIQQIDSTLVLKKDKSKEVLKRFLHLSKDLKVLRQNSTSSDADDMKTIQIVLDILPTVIGMGDTAYFDHIFKLLLHLLMRSSWKFVENAPTKPDFFLALHKAFLTILSQACLAVKAKSYKVWLETIRECGSSDYKAVLDPLTNESIMSLLVVRGLSQEETKEDVSQILFHACKDDSIRPHVGGWLLWLECHKDDGVVGPVVRSVLIALNHDRAAEHDLVPWTWSCMRHLYFKAFSTDKVCREDALNSIYHRLEKEGRGMESVKNFSYLASSLEYKFPTEVHTNIRQDAQEGEVQTLVTIFTNEKIDVGIQKSSAVQLLLALGRSLRHILIPAEVLDKCSRVIEECSTSGRMDYDEEYLGTVLLIVAYSAKRDLDSTAAWFSKRSEDFFQTFSRLLFHSSISLQQTAAVILFSVIFGEEKNRLHSSGLCLRGKTGEADLAVAEAFEGHVRPPASCAFLGVGPREGSFDLVEEIASKVKDTIDTRNAIKTLVGGGASKSDLPEETREMVENLHPKLVLENALSQMKDAKTHEECQSWILLLLNYCSCNTESLQELSALNWFEPFQTFLSSTPTSKKDWSLWSAIFTMISRMLDNCGLSHTLLMNLVLLYDEAILPSIFQEEYWDPMSPLKHGIRAQLESSQGLAVAKKGVRSESICNGLEMFAALLKSNRASGNIAVQKYMVDTLGNEETINTFAEFAMCDRWDYSFRVLTTQCLVELLICYLDLKALDVYQYTPSDLDSVFSSVVPKIIKYGCIAQISPGHGRGILKHSLEYLKQVTNLGREAWAGIWADTDCTFWISKLLRDPETLVRKTSLQILCALSNPVSAPLISMLNRHWPERLYNVVKIAFDEGECDLVRAKAMQILSLALALERSEGENQQDALVSETYPTRSSIKKSLYQTVQEYKFWDILKNSMSWNRSQLMGGFLSMVSEMLVSDAHYVFQNCKISQICKVATAVFNSCSKHLDQRLNQGESCFDAVIPLSMALNVLQVLLRKEKLFPKVLHWIPSMNICNIYCSFSGRISSVLKKELPYRVSYYSACLPLLMQFSAVIANLMHVLLGEHRGAETKEPTMTGEEMRNSITQVSRSICFIFRCQILPAQVKEQCCKLLEISLQVNDLACAAMDQADEQRESNELIGAILCDHLVADMRSISKHMKMGISARRQSLVQINSRANATTLALRALIACSKSGKLAMIRNKFYQDLMMEFRVHSNAILAASLHSRKEDPRITAKSEGRLMRIFLLLKHFAYKSRVCSDVLTKEGAVDLVRAQLAAYPKGNAQVQNGALGLLVNMAANSSAACLEIIDVKVPSKNRQPSFFLQVLEIWEKKKSLRPITELCGYIVQALVQIQESRTAILKTDFVGRMIGFLERLLKKKDSRKFGQVLKFLSDLAAFRDSRSFLLHHPSFSDLMDFLLAVGDLEDSDQAMEEVLLFLRNMSFSSDMKTYLLSREEVLQMLLTRVYDFSASPKMASYASNSLWILLYKSQRMKASIRNLGEAHDRLLSTEAELALHGKTKANSRDARHIQETMANLQQVTTILWSGQNQEEEAETGDHEFCHLSPNSTLIH
ncbi:hypothetical protein A3770_01p05550 [Chloropicon primus]|uniref:Uncharacterized protein n=1 Tax=Chloropicon primus TaxID=1764295 RepID=A0A5B8MC62_9CHLO|nr:hypothetical protein A3770_01p05550 [Chloropicon primus]|eukprot:QDZ18037.1 hypothetical protein A3770_01p05550 [Chloropicon primus]